MVHLIQQVRTLWPTEVKKQSHTAGIELHVQMKAKSNMVHLLREKKLGGIGRFRRLLRRVNE
jgi:hypothetical protein